MATMEKCIPTKNISSHRRLPYITKELVLLIRKKVRLYKQAVRLNTTNSWLKYNKARNRATSALRKAKQSFFTNLSSRIRSPKDFWSAYHKLSPKHHRIPVNLSYLSQIARDPSEKANLLNHFFCSCFNDNTPSMSPTPNPAPSDTPTLSTISCSEEEVFHLLSTYKTRTASGPDGISSIMLRKTATSISSKLTTFFNLSLRLGKVPSQWKVSNVIPILKSGDPSNASNYRPISLLSLVSKVLERIIFNQISHHLSINRLLSKSQFGFRSGFSTQEALLSVTNDWHQLLSKNHQIAAVFFDVKKAFDSVPHTLILQSLSSVGISGPLLSWFEDYLTGRQQRVVVDGVSSPLSPVTSGVPQGSILGPLLFIIFMNSINYLPLSPGSKLVLYADDIVLYRPINSPEDVSIIQEDINQILNWTKAHSLTLNSAKTNLLPVTRSPRPIPIHLNLGSNPIQTVSSVKYLGVTITHDLSWKRHTLNVIKAAKSQIGLLHRKLYQATPQARHAIYKSAILPRLEYCCSVWDPHSTTLINELEKTQKFAGRVITKNWNSDYATILNDLNWLPLSTRRKMQKLKVCYNILNDFSCIPSTSFTLHPRPSPRHPHNRIIFMPLVKTVAHKSSFFIDVIYLWNILRRLVANAREFPLTALYLDAGKGYIGRPVQLCAPFAPRNGLDF